MPDSVPNQNMDYYNRTYVYRFRHDNLTKCAAVCPEPNEVVNYLMLKEKQTSLKRYNEDKACKREDGRTGAYENK